MAATADAERLPEIDAVKAAAIITVVFIHSLRASWEPGFTQVERICSEMARFAVPAFLAVSGFLYYSAKPIDRATIGRRLRRIVLPYLTASVLAYVFLQRYPQFDSGLSFPVALLVASTFGPFYYVFLLSEFVLASWLLSRMPRRWVIPLTVGSYVAIATPFLLLEDGVKPTIWNLRLPIYFFCWFMTGWAAAAFREPVWRFVERRRAALLLGWLAVVGLWVALDVGRVLSPQWSRVSSLGLIAANIAGVFALARGARDLPSWAVGLSDRTYAVYLFHLFFVYAVLAAFGDARPDALVASTVAAWGAGMAGSLLVIAVVRRLLPGASRDLIGV